MKLSGVLWVFVGLLFLTSAASGQTIAPAASSEVEKNQQENEKKALPLLEKAIGDADSLKLPENRVNVFALAGDLLWTRDEARARRLFRRAANEISAQGNEAEDGEDALPENFWMLQNVRNQFLNQVAERDAELALEFLRQTRFPVFDRVSNLPADKIPLYRNLYSSAQNELNLEKELVTRLIEKNPRRALEIARANLSKGATHSDLNLINQLKNSDPKAASQFADEVLQKLAATDFTDAYDHNSRSVALNFISQFSAPPNSAEENSPNKNAQFSIDKNALRRLAIKYADYLLSGTLEAHNYQQIENTLPVFERLLPDRVAALRQKFERLKQNYSAVYSHNQYQEKFGKLAGNAAPETLIAEAENFPIEMRSQIYGAAANRMSAAGNYARARQLLASLPGKQTRQYALFQLDWQALQNFLNEEKYSEAEQIIAQQTDNSHKISLLTQTANYFFGKKQNEKAVQYISQANSMVNPNPDNYFELHNLIQVLGASAVIAPEKTFDLLESFVPKFNEIFAATAFLSKYQTGYGNFREGEMVFSNGYNGFYMSERRGGGVYVNLDSMRLDRLAKADLERSMNLADRFDRADVRLAARLIILRGVLSNKETRNQQIILD